MTILKIFLYILRRVDIEGTTGLDGANGRLFTGGRLIGSDGKIDRGRDGKLVTDRDGETRGGILGMLGKGDNKGRGDIGTITMLAGKVNWVILKHLETGDKAEREMSFDIN